MEEQVQAVPTNEAPKTNSKEDNLARQRKIIQDLEARLDKAVTALENVSSRQAPSQAEVREHNPYQRYGLEKGSFVEADKFVDILERERQQMRQENEQVYNKLQKQTRLEKFQSKCPNYDQVVTEENVQKLEMEDPVFTKSLEHITDELTRAELAYDKIKSITAREERRSAQDVVDSNKKNNYYYARGGHEGVPASMNLNPLTNDPETKQREYMKLKAAQKRGLLR